MGILKGRVKQLRLSSGERKKEGKVKYHWGAITVVVIIVAAFVIAPVIPSFLGGKVYTFGSYKGVPIKFYPGSDMERELSYLMRENPIQGEGPYRQFYYQQIWYTAFMRQAMHLAIGERVKHSGLMLSQEQLNELLRNYSGFADAQGKFDLNTYKRYSVQQKASISEHLKEAYLWAHYQADLVGSPIPPSLFSFLQELQKTSLVLSWFKVTKDDIPLEDLQALVKDKADLLWASDVVLVAGSQEKELEKILLKLKDKCTSLEEINPEQKEDYEGALFYELANLVKEQQREKLSCEFKQEGEWTSIYCLADGRYGFFYIKKPAHFPDLSQSVERNKVVLYMQMQEKELYEAILRRLALSKFDKSSKNEDRVSFNPSACNLYPAHMGGLSAFAGKEEFFTLVFSLKEGERTQPFCLGEEVYIFELIKREEQANLQEASIREQLKKDLVLNLQEDLLNGKDFKNNFWQVYYKSGIAELVASQT